MDHTNEKKLAARAKLLGESAHPQVFTELADLARSASPLVRRLAASALGKLSGVVAAGDAIGVLQPLLQDAHPQVRQYTAKALGAFGADAKSVLDDLRDLYRDPSEKDYVRRSVLRAGKTIREACRIVEARKVHKCRRCGVQVEADEYARSMRAFNRIFCDNCFDEVYLDRRNWDMKVELQKSIKARDGTVVQSDGERRIADWLSGEQIVYRYDERIRIIDGYAIRPDFYLPEFDVYLEYWGMNTTDYKIGMLKKKKLYQQQGKRLVSIYPEDCADLNKIIRRKLAKYIRVSGEWDSG